MNKKLNEMTKEELEERIIQIATNIKKTANWKTKRDLTKYLKKLEEKYYESK